MVQADTCCDVASDSSAANSLSALVFSACPEIRLWLRLPRRQVKWTQRIAGQIPSSAPTGRHQRWSFFIIFVIVWPLLGSCRQGLTIVPTSTQPVAKIGLLAPFEGLHRRNGYAALAAMRLAIEDYRQNMADEHLSDQDAMAIIPLALHLDTDGLQTGVAQRTVAKLLADPELAAVVGPYDPAVVLAVESTLTGSALPWLLPFVPNRVNGEQQPAAFSQELTIKWLVPLLAEVATRAAQQGATRLVVAGWQASLFSPTFLDGAMDVEALPLPLYFVAEASATNVMFDSGDALFWLDTPEAAAAFLATQDVSGWEPVSLWFGPAGDDPLLGELFLSEFTFDSNKIYWVTWLDNHYIAADAPEANDQRTASNDSTSPTPLAPFRSLTPTAYLTYRATQAAIASLNPIYIPPPAQWRVVTFARQSDGTSRRVDGVKE